MNPRSSLRGSIPGRSATRSHHRTYGIYVVVGLFGYDWGREGSEHVEYALKLAEWSHKACYGQCKTRGS